jgi:hypothetical protein
MCDQLSVEADSLTLYKHHIRYAGADAWKALNGYSDTLFHNNLRIIHFTSFIDSPN